MGQNLEVLKQVHENVKKNINILSIEKVSAMCLRWKELGIPFIMTVNEFQKSVVMSEDMHLNYENFKASNEIEALGFLTKLIVMSTGELDKKLKCNPYSGLFDFYRFEEGSKMTPDEFYVLIDKTLRSISSEGCIELDFINSEGLEDFKDSLFSNQSNLSFSDFKSSLTSECSKLAHIFQESYNFLRTLSTHIIDDPFPVITFLQPGNLFLGKYEITKTPELIKYISSIYKRKYKHALLEVKAMIGEENNLKFELIYQTGINGDKSFRQNYFREIVLKKHLLKTNEDEFGELPGGILYKQISEVETMQETLAERFDKRKEEAKMLYPFQQNKRNIVCLTEHETIELGQKLLVQLNELHKEKVIHSNLNKSSVYWVDGEIQFLDLELAIWDPIDILKKPNAYFQQLEGDKYDITFRDEEFLAPEHKELADEYQTTGNIPSSKIEASCDIYSIGAILFTALTGKKVKTYTEEIAIITEDSNKSPKCLDDIIISNEMVKFIMKILHKNPKERFEDISKVQKELKRIYESLEKIPKKLLKCLEHIPIKNPDKKLKYFQDDYVLQLQQYAFNDFCLDYIYKFILESNIPNIRIFGAAVFPLRQLRLNQITSLELSGQTIHAEELKILSFFIKINSSLTDIDLSKNPLMQRHPNESTGRENHESGNDNQASNIGFNDFLEALNHHSNLKSFELAGVDLGPHFAEKLCHPLAKNKTLEKINLSGCELRPQGVKFICEMAESMNNLRYINLSSNSCGDEGAVYIAKLIKNNHNIQEIDLFRNGISKEGGGKIGSALTENFIIHKLSIGDNEIKEKHKNSILQSVMFNTQYEKLKATNKRFGEFGYNLMAESIIRWTSNSKFVENKLIARLGHHEDEIDKKLAELLIDPVTGKINHKPSTSMQMSIGIPETNLFQLDPK